MPRPVRGRLSSVVSLLTVALAGCSVMPTGGTVPGEPVEIPLHPYVAGLRTVDVEIGGRSYPMIFDTAGGINLVTPKVAAEIGCEPFGRLTGFRHNGDLVSSKRCGAMPMSAGSWVPTAAEVGVFDLMALLEGAPEVGGLVGLPLFAGRAVTVDFARNRVIVESAESLETRKSDMQPLEIRDARQAGGAALDIFVAVETEAGKIWLELDSGNAGPVMLSPHALKQLGIDIQPEETSAVTLPIAGLGPVSVQARNHDSIYDGLLNRAFFESMIVTLDLRTMRGWAKRVDAAGATAEP